MAFIAVILLLITMRGHPFKYNYEFFDATNSAATDAVMANQTDETVLNTASTDSAAKIILTDPGSLRACIAAADVCGTRDGYFKNTLSVGEDMTVTGRLGVGGNTALNSDLDILGALAVNGMATINKGTNIKGMLGVTNTLSTQQNASVLGNLSVNQNVVAGNSVSITNDGIIRGQTNISGDAIISGQANVKNVANVGNTLLVQGATNVAGSLNTKSHMNVSGNVTVGGNATVGGSVLMSRDAQVNGSLSIMGPLSVIKNGMRIEGKTHLGGEAISIAKKLNVLGLTQISGGVNIQSKHGEITSIGERQDGQNVIYGSTIVRGNKFCLNKECLNSAQLQTIKNNETELSAMLEVWDKEIVGNIKTAKANLDTYTKNIDSHNTSEKSTYESLLKAYEDREHSINDIAAKIPSLKKALADNWLYEIKQDDRIRQIGRDIVTVSGPYFGAVESTLKPNECPPPPPPRTSWRVRISLYNDPNYTGTTFSDVYEANEKEYQVEIKNNPAMQGMEDKISSLKIEPDPGVTASLTLMYHPIHEFRRSPDTEQTWTAINGQKVEVPDLEKVGNLDDEASAMIIKVVRA